MSKSYLFVCVENSCRSQIAEAWAKEIFAKDTVVASAGSRPSGIVNPNAIKVMLEAGIDISQSKSGGLPDPEERNWDYIITMGCGDSCPQIPAKNRLDWKITDPKGREFGFFQQVREEIRSKIVELKENE